MRDDGEKKEMFEIREHAHWQHNHRRRMDHLHYDQRQDIDRHTTHEHKKVAQEFTDEIGSTADRL